MARKRSPLKPLTRADIILRNAVKKNKDAGIQPKHQIARRLFDDENNIATSTPKIARRLFDDVNEFVTSTPNGKKTQSKIKYSTVSPIKKNCKTNTHGAILTPVDDKIRKELDGERNPMAVTAVSSDTDTHEMIVTPSDDEIAAEIDGGRQPPAVPAVSSDMNSMSSNMLSRNLSKFLV